MKLIVDAGSTKTAWGVVDESANPVLMLRSRGINPATMPTEVIMESLQEVHEQLSGFDFDSVTYYGAGIVNDATAQLITGFLSNVLTTRKIEVLSDMVGAARAVLGNRPGIACILGTGSNSCRYDGECVVANVPALGFILGDEGSGASLGRRFIGDLFKGMLPDSVTSAWQGDVGLSMPEVIDKVYRQPAPGAFLASIAPFIHSQMHVPEVRGMVLDEFNRFFERNVERYDVSSRLIGFVGGIATLFSTEIAQIAAERNFTITSIIADPLPDLLK